MRSLAKFVCAMASVLLTFGVIVLALGFVAFGTPDGQDFVRGQTEAAVQRIVGPDFSVALGAQSISFSPQGSFAIDWSDVSIVRKTGDGRPLEAGGQVVGQIDAISVGVRVTPLLGGRLEFESLDVDGARIDLTGTASVDAAPPAAGSGDAAPPAGTSVDTAPPAATLTPTAVDDGRDHLKRMGDSLFAGIEERFGELGRLGIKTVALSNIKLTAPLGVDGGPVVSRIERADFAMSDPSHIAFSASLGVDPLSLRLAGDASFDPARKRLMSASFSAGPVDLAAIAPPGPAEDRLDSRPFGSTAKATIVADVASDLPDGRRTARLGLNIGDGALQTGRGHTRIERTALSLVYREGEDQAGIAEGQVAFDDFTMRLEGRIVPIYDAPQTATFNGYGFEVKAADMRSTIGARIAGADPRAADLTIKGRSNMSEQRLLLSGFDLVTDGGTLSGNGSHEYGSATARTRLDLTGRNLSASDVKAFWPYNIAVSTRRWVLEHIGEAGRVTDGTIALDLLNSRLGPAFKPKSHPDADEMQLVFDLDDIDLTTPGDLPRIVGAKGRVTTTGGDTLVAVEKAGIEGFDKVDMSEAVVRFDRAPAGGLEELDGSLHLKFSGSMPDLLALVDRKPIDALRSGLARPRDGTGRATVSADLFMLMGDDVPKDKQFAGYDVSAKLDNAGLKTPVDGRIVSGLDGTLHVVPGLATLDAEGKIDDVAAKIALSQPFGPTPSGARKLELTASFGADDIAELAPALSDIVGGAVSAKLVETGAQIFRANVDLSDASLQLPWIGWRKGRGVNAGLTFDIERTDGGTLLKNVLLKGDGFSAAGTIGLDKDGLRTAELTNAALNPGDNVEVTMKRVSNGMSVRVDGSSFDARPFLKDLKDSLGAKADAAPKATNRQLDVGVAIDSLTGFGNEKVGRFALDYAGSGNAVAALSVAGTTAKGGRFTIDLSPKDDGRSIKVRTSDAGRLLDFAGLYGRMEGGAASLDLTGSSTDGYIGQLAADNFVLVDEPRLSSIVGSSPAPNTASLSKALGRDINTSRAAFDHASAGIAYGKGGLRLSDGIIRGPVFGSSFSGKLYDQRNRIDIVGSFMPAYGLNGIFRDIPIVGQILGNGSEGGIIGITYKLDGQFASPKLTVNPISAIAPGIFRSIFAYR